MQDPFAQETDRLVNAARRAYEVVPSDTEPLPILPKAGIFIGTGGNVTLRAVDSDTDVTYRNMADCSFIAVRAMYIRATGTTAQHMVAEA